MKEKLIIGTKNLTKGKTNWHKVKKLTDQQINKAAKTDKDALPSSKNKLKKFKRVNPPALIDISHLRKKLHISQEQFAAYFGISKRTLQEWEQGRRIPNGPARALITVIAKEPKAVQRALGG